MTVGENFGGGKGIKQSLTITGVIKFFFLTGQPMDLYLDSYMCSHKVLIFVAILKWSLPRECLGKKDQKVLDVWPVLQFVQQYVAM